MDDLTKAQDDLEMALDELLALQAQSRGDVSMEMLTALARVSCAMEDLAIIKATLSVRIKPSAFDQKVDLDSTEWAVPESPLAAPAELH